MTKKDYIKIADVINNSLCHQTNLQKTFNIKLLNKDTLINNLCTIFKDDNANFNEKTFKKYTK